MRRVGRASPSCDDMAPYHRIPVRVVTQRSKLAKNSLAGLAESFHDPLSGAMIRSAQRLQARSERVPEGVRERAWYDLERLIDTHIRGAQPLVQFVELIGRAGERNLLQAGRTVPIRVRTAALRHFKERQNAVAPEFEEIVSNFFEWRISPNSSVRYPSPEVTSWRE